MGIVNTGALLSPPLGGIIYAKAGVIAVIITILPFLALPFFLQLLVVEKGSQPEHTDDSGSASPARPGDSEGSRLLSTDNGDFQTRSTIIQRVPILLCFLRPSFLAAISLSAVQATFVGAFDAILPVQITQQFHYTSLKIGLLFLPLGLARLTFSPFGGWATDRFGAKVVAVVGNLFLMPVLILFRECRGDSTHSVVIFCFLLALIGIGMATMGTPSFVESAGEARRVEKESPGLFPNGPMQSLSGINMLAFNSGLTLGPTIAGLLVDSIGYDNMLIVLAGLAGITAIISFVWLGGKPACIAG